MFIQTIRVSTIAEGRRTRGRRVNWSGAWGAGRGGWPPYRRGSIRAARARERSRFRIRGFVSAPRYLPNDCIINFVSFDLDNWNAKGTDKDFSSRIIYPVLSILKWINERYEECPKLACLYEMINESRGRFARIVIFSNRSSLPTRTVMRRDKYHYLICQPSLGYYEALRVRFNIY